MDQRAGFPHPSFLDMPLRDMARGLSGLAHFTEDALAPVHASLPKPLQTALSEAASVIKSGGASLVSLGIDQTDIAQAAAFLKGIEPDHRHGSACAKVIAFAWDHMEAGGLVSETLLASHLSAKATQNAAPHHAAAALIWDMADSNAFGPIPGLPTPENRDPRVEIVRTLIVPAIWLIAEREATLEAEMHLLELTIALAGAFETDISAALSDQDALAGVIKTLADHL